MLFQQKVATVDQVQFRVGQVVQERLRSRHDEEGIVLPPHDERARLVHAEVFVPRVVERHVRGVPLTFRGGAPVPNIALNFAGKPGVNDRNASLIQAMYQGQDLAPAVAEGFQVQTEVYNAISGEMMAANRNAVTARGFELSAQRIGLLMQDKFNLGFVDVGGWDTHVNQGAADGYLAGRIGELGRGLAALKAALGNKWNETVVIVVSEFGRTFRENGDRGQIMATAASIGC